MPTPALYTSGQQHRRAPLNPSASPLLAALASNGPYRKNVKVKTYPPSYIATRFAHTNTGMQVSNTFSTPSFKHLNTLMNPTQIRRQ